MFSMVVRMYRALERPDVVGNVFEYEGHATRETVEQINQVNELPQHFGFFQRRNIIDNQIDIEFSLAATREYGRFHSNVAAFIAATPSLAWGNPPEEYYICDIDFYSFDDKEYIMMRNAYLQDNTPVQVGLMAACPDGNGFKAIFENFTVKHLPDQRRLEWLKKNQ